MRDANFKPQSTQRAQRDPLDVGYNKKMGLGVIHQWKDNLGRQD